MNTASTFGTLLRQLRKRAGMTQGDLAAAVGYSVSFVSDLEQNRRLPAVAVVLQQFVPALGLQEETGFAGQLVELAALARGERPPATVMVQRKTQLTVTETFTFPASRLPVPPTALIGREEEVKTLCNRLQGHNGRLLTLVGPPGVGKTRLGLAIAAQSERAYPDGAYFVPLAAINEPEQVATELVVALPISDTSQRSPKVKLIEFLRRKELLLVLDNFEQITPAAGLVAELLAQCPGVRILVTSRERLHLRAEQRYQVPPLALDVAVTLFTQRAQAVDFAFAPITEQQPVIAAICQRLDCLPLAIELIAARIDLLSPQSMLTRLQECRLEQFADGAQDVPERQRTLRSAIQSSYALLDEREQRLFRTLGVFVDGFDLAAVAHFGFDAQALQALLNKSLVHSAERPAPHVGAERRFLLLETLREYAREQLMINQEADWVQRQHAAYYAQWVEGIEPHLRGSQAKAFVAQLETEHNNLRAALTWTLATANAETALRLSGALGRFWIMHGHVREGKTWLAQTLALSAQTPSPVQAKARMAAGHLTSILGEFPAAQRFFEQSLDLYQSLNDRQGVAWVLYNLGDAFYAQNAFAHAHEFYQQSLAVYQTLEDKQGLADLYTGMGWLAVSQGDYAQAKTAFVQGLAVWRAQGEHEAPITILKGLASVASQQQDYAQASTILAELLMRNRALEDNFGVAYALNHLGRIALYQGELAQATIYLTEGFGLAQALGYPAFLLFALDNQGNLAFAQGDYTTALHYYRQSLETAYQLEDKFNIATLFEHLASVMGVQQKAEQATQLLGAAAYLHEVIAAPLRHIERLRYEATVAAIRVQLDETEYARAYAEGYAMTLDQAVAFALAQFGEG